MATVNASQIWFARMCLGERMIRRDAVATALIMFGIVLVALGGTKESTCFTLDELVSLYGEPPFIVYITTVALTSIAMYSFSKYAQRLKEEHGVLSRGVHPYLSLLSSSLPLLQDPGARNTHVSKRRIFLHIRLSLVY
jgi:hypothetical protein